MRARLPASVRALFAEFGIEPALPVQRGLAFVPEARSLRFVELGTDGRDKFLTPAAARAYKQLREAAQRDGLALQLISAFRSIDFQAALIRAKLARGISLDEVLRINAPPGYSEHHSGCAVDLGVADVAALDEAFENTAAYAWLREHAARFGFVLSYPRGNAQGYCYEPWHWCYRA
ncbi:D-alanyl-D-alanine carboxypeptidase [Solimonas aquatica]|uniref:D-alanyl-D-alanine carboxypeptidase n=1 Tax=Solimonas aquatica TaxID=489703 RepID=A0A1H9GN82_9GAMM|nr:M15 family metallopeptidase [Solimonas aquatica]SEQ51464.1 D-alanyl-D-alanine carboxypeptidase [Solimonas aquatica]